MKLYSKIIILLLFISFNSISQNEKDSALSIIKSNLNDSLKIDQLAILMDECADYKTRYFIAGEFFKIVKRMCSSDNLAVRTKGLINLGYTFYNYAALNEDQLKYHQAIYYYNKGIEIYKFLNYKQGLSDHYNNIARIYSRSGKIEKALEFYLKALEIDLKRNVPEDVAYLYNNIGGIYNEINEKEKALDYFRKGIELAEANNHHQTKFLLYTNIGSFYLHENKLDSCLLYNRKALTISNIIKIPDVAVIYNNISTTYFNNKIYDSSLYYIDLAIIESKKASNFYDYSRLLKNKAVSLRMSGKINEAEKYGLEAYSIAVKNKMSKGIKLSAEFLGEFYIYKNDYKKSLHYKTIANEINDSLNIDAVNKSTMKMQMEFDFSLRENKLIAEREKNELILKAEKNKQSFIKNIFIGSFLVMFIIAGIVFNNYRNKKKANVLINEQKNLLAKQHADLEEKQKEIIDSIQYAKRLQEAILIPEKDFKNYFNDSFIIYKPKDIVSGDFYWIAESEQNKIIAVADCTGHGVPGAFMSMLGYEMLQDILLKEHIKTTSAALKNLDIKMTDSLNKSNKNYRDGMDIALCAFSKLSNELQYSGANRPLIKISDGILEEYKPSKLNIGGDIDGSEKNFLQNTIQVKQGDVFYMFTDGFADQFGGENNKKFSYKKLKELLLEVHLKPMQEQKLIIENTYNQWKGNYEQIDDVCLIGIKI